VAMDDIRTSSTVKLQRHVSQAAQPQHVAL
jgi:hypothetical protein